MVLYDFKVQDSHTTLFDDSIVNVSHENQDYSIIYL